MSESSLSREVALPAQPSRPASTVPAPPVYWLKTTNPDARIADFEPGTDVRVLLPDDVLFEPLRERLSVRGVAVRSVRYWLEREVVTDVADDGGMAELACHTAVCHLARGVPREPVRREGAAAAVARDAFDALWQTGGPAGHSAAANTVPVAEVVPAAWVPFLPHTRLNPAQAQAAPEVLDSDEPLLVVAPTGAGKTTIGMLAALRAVLRDKRKAAWLVPQRSLTDELNRELEAWRERGLRVERLSGEHIVDAERVRNADLWVTTTEKFEVICRTSSLREALAEVGCLIVDEIHLLGDVERGPVLEALLARVREEGSTVRTVGLSATVSNADQVAAWMRARLVRIAWRPSRLTWQLPVIPAASDWSVAQAARTRVTNGIVDMVTADDGSVLVFCGSKFSVRSTALAIAASRGVNTGGVRPDDLEDVHRVCSAARIGLHYKDWEHKKEAERAFRERETDVLVATSTVAAGVNLPARAVVVRDSQIGLRDVDVATVQQMFGRAGRVGAGEHDGWAFLIVDETERAQWQEKLIGGYSVSSQISSSLPDHVLAEVVQGRVGTLDEAEQWWLGTFAHHQGSRSADALHRAVNFLVGADYLTLTEEADRTTIAATELGTLTTRVMVGTYTGYHLRSALASSPLPRDADEAERQLAAQVATIVPKLAKAPLAENLKPAVMALLRADGRLSRLAGAAGESEPAEVAASYAPGDLARASLLAVANSPAEFARPRREFATIPHPTMYPVLEDAPRYLHWLGSQGYLGTLHPWAVIVAADLSRRVRWRRCAPTRGSGRLLWMCEQMATGVHAEREVPTMWAAARERGLVHPDWPSRVPPRGCRLDATSYPALLRERVAEREVPTGRDGVVTHPAAGRVVCTWSGSSYQPVTGPPGSGEQAVPLAGESNEHRGLGAAVFSWRGDYRATGWLADYSQMAKHRGGQPRPAHH